MRRVEQRDGSCGADLNATAHVSKLKHGGVRVWRCACIFSSMTPVFLSHDQLARRCNTIATLTNT